MAGKVTLYVLKDCPDCARVKARLDACGVAYDEREVGADPEAAKIAAGANFGRLRVPVVEKGGKRYAAPSDAELANLFGGPCEDMRADVVVVGSGPAGLTAAIYLAREQVRVVVLERGAIGGQVVTTNEVENYPGFPEGIMGPELMGKLEAQARRFGAEVLAPVGVTRLALQGGEKVVRTAKGDWRASCVVLAPGSDYRRLDAPGSRELSGRGVSYCATCDGPFFRGKDIVVVGGGNAAVDESLFLLRFVNSLTLLPRRDHLTAEKVTAEKLLASEKTRVLYRHVVTAIEGEGRVAAVRARDLATGEERRIETGGVFVFIGRVPNTKFLEGAVELDERSFVRTKPGSVETSFPGVYAAGDCRSGSRAQITTAVGEGTVAAFFARDYLAARKR